MCPIRKPFEGRLGIFVQYWYKADNISVYIYMYVWYV